MFWHCKHHIFLFTHKELTLVGQQCCHQPTQRNLMLLLLLLLMPECPWHHSAAVLTSIHKTEHISLTNSQQFEKTMSAILHSAALLSEALHA